jgi:SNF2 family DNA or RNA helicase
MYDRVLEGIYETLSEWSPGAAGEEKAVMNMLVKLMRLKQICSVDRIDYVADTAVEINDSLEERANGSHKDNSHKVLVFTQFRPIAHAITRRLGNEAVCMTGELNAQQRESVISKFKTDPEIRFLVATDKVASEGLNLQEAHAVVFADLLWTPAGHEQCEGRAYGRLADLHGIDSYWCAAVETVDEHILKILQRKMTVINQVVEGMEVDRQSSVVKELLSVMKEELGRKRK